MVVLTTTLDKLKALILSVVIIVGITFLQFSEVSSSNPNNHLSLKIFGGNLLIPGNYSVSTEKLNNRIIVLSPSSSMENSVLKENLTYMVGIGDSTELMLSTKWFIERLNLVEVLVTEYKEFSIVRYSKAERTDFYDNLAIEELVTIFKDNEFLIIFGDYEKGKEDYYKELLSTFKEAKANK